MKHINRQGTLSKTTTNQKPPKLRFKPGTFVRDADKQLYCIRVACRLKSNPSEWLYWLEYRNGMNNPSTVMSMLCDGIQGGGCNSCVVLWEPLYDSIDAYGHDLCRNMYHFGDSKCVTNKDMINKYVVVSSGELLDLKS